MDLIGICALLIKRILSFGKLFYEYIFSPSQAKKILFLESECNNQSSDMDLKWDLDIELSTINVRVNRVRSKGLWLISNRIHGKCRSLLRYIRMISISILLLFIFCIHVMCLIETNLFTACRMTCLNSNISPWKKFWKLLCLVISKSSSS